MICGSPWVESFFISSGFIWGVGDVSAQCVTLCAGDVEERLGYVWFQFGERRRKIEEEIEWQCKIEDVCCCWWCLIDLFMS